jgi:beta-galactosidase
MQLFSLPIGLTQLTVLSLADKILRLQRVSLRSGCAIILCLLFTHIASAETPRRASFDADWKFNLGEADGAEKPDFADTNWRKLDLPHDWMIEGPPGKDPAAMDGPFDEKSPGGAGNGYLDGGIGWYRKTFTIPADDKGKHIAIDFDGIYMNSHVWINGHDLGIHPYGYTSFEYDLTPYLKYGDGKNEIAVRAEVIQPCSRFYSGAGIYRNVWLVTTNAVHVDHWGTYVVSEVKDNTARVTARIKVSNHGQDNAAFKVVSEIQDPQGKTVAVQDEVSKGTLTISAGAVSENFEKFTIPNPNLWSVENPVLYRLITDVTINDKVADHYETHFGIRTIEFTVDDGFHLNGKRVQLNGVCDHHDLGCLGAAINTRAIQRQLEILKSFGVNAIRTSHYPPAPELLDLCDQMGFVVMDEAFDEWKHSKTRYGYGQFFDDWSERDILSMVDRDRNHPSVVMWSIGNEINEQGAKNGGEMATRLADFVKKEDPTRPTVSAMSNPNGALKSGFSEPLGVFGVNYNIGFYDNPGVHGKKPMLGSETASALSSRGEYGLTLDKQGKITVQKEFDHQVTSYDIVNPGWGHIAETSLMAIASHPWMAGEFVWTGFDYIGEPTPYKWPSRSSYFGIVDLCGFPKDRYYLYKSQWTIEPVVHILPHWNWEQFAGKEIPVDCFTNADSVELFLDGKSLGEKSWANDRKLLHLEWSVPFEPGVLKAVAKKDGKIVATDEVHTAGKAAKIVLKADRSEIKPVDRDMSFVTVSVEDKDGNICPTAEDEIKFTIDGPGIIAGVGNGDATNHESFQGHQHKVFNGLGLVVIQAGTQPGEIHLTATGDGLERAAITVSVK